MVCACDDESTETRIPSILAENGEKERERETEKIGERQRNERIEKKILSAA